MGIKVDEGRQEVGDKVDRVESKVEELKEDLTRAREGGEQAQVGARFTCSCVRF